MESEIASDLHEDNRDVNLSRQSLQTTKKNSRASQKHKKNLKKDEDERCIESSSKTKRQNTDPDRDHISDREYGQRSSGSFYSEDYDNESPERSLSPYSHSRTPSPSLHRGVQAKRMFSSPHYKTGM